MVKKAKGKLGILLPGMGAVASTLIAGVFAVRKGISLPIGSVSQMGRIRLGKRTEGRNPLIKDFAPIAKFDDIAFGGWDIFSDNMYKAAKNAEVLDRELLDKIKPELKAIKPMKAVFDKKYVKNLDGKHVKKAKTKMDLAKQLMDDIKKFKKENKCSRVVMVWCGSTETYMKEGDVHSSLKNREASS